MIYCSIYVFQYCNSSHRDLLLRTHSFPTRRSADLSTAAAGVPGSAVPGGSTRMPEWSVPRFISAVEQIMPSDVRPYVWRLAMVKSPGSTAPGRDRKSTRLNSSHSCAYRMPHPAWTNNTRHTPPQTQSSQLHH